MSSFLTTAEARSPGGNWGGKIPEVRQWLKRQSGLPLPNDFVPPGTFEIFWKDCFVNRNWRLAAGFTILLLIGCDDAPPKVDTPVKYAPPEEGAEGKSSSDGAASIRVGPFERQFEGIALSVPAGWKEVERVQASK